MRIPKVIYQTWKTKQLTENCARIRENIQRLNPDYTMILYDDSEMDDFIKTNFDEHIYSCYSKLYVGAAKADFWRYCILYKNGGVYLDIDSDIYKSLDELIHGDEQCIITRSNDTFNNWIMIFEAGHPILWKTIQLCCENIINRTTNYVVKLTGPDVLTDAINIILKPFYNKEVGTLSLESDEALNSIFYNKTNTLCIRFYQSDMGEYAGWKHRFANELYWNNVYWQDEKRIFVD